MQRFLSVEPLEARTLLTASVASPLAAADDIPVVTAESFALAAEASQTIISAVVEHNGVASFLVKNEPRIERYDITNEVWLPAMPLPQNLGPATILYVDDDGVFVAYSKSVYRYDADGGNSRHVVDTPYEVHSLYSKPDWLFVDYSGDRRTRLVSIDKSTNSIIATYDAYADTGRTDVLYKEDGKFVVADNGGFGYGVGYEYYPHYASPGWIWAYPDGSKAVNQSGTIYAMSNGLQLATLGYSVKDVGFVGSDIPIVLHGATLTVYTNTYVATHNYTLSNPADEIFINDRNVVTFTADASSAHGLRVGLVSLADLEVPWSDGRVNPVGLAYTPDDVILAADGTLLLHSKKYQSIFRWDTVNQQYLPTIPVMSTANYMAYSPITNTIYLAYNAGQIRQISLDSADPAEVAFVMLSRRPQTLVAAGRYVFTVDPGWDTGFEYTFSPDGTLIDKVATDYRSNIYMWNEATQKVYSYRNRRNVFETNMVVSEEINASGDAYDAVLPGGIGQRREGPAMTYLSNSLRTWFSPDGRHMLTQSGEVYDATSLQLFVYNLDLQMQDAAWTGQGLYSIRSPYEYTIIQRWDPVTYVSREWVRLPGKSVALELLDENRLLAVTLSKKGIPAFTFLDLDLQAIGTRDVTDQLDLYVSGRQYNRATGTYSFYVSASNAFDTPLTELRLKITDLTPDNVQVLNADGVDENGVAYFNILSRTGQNQLNAREGSASLVILLAVPPRQAYNFRLTATGKSSVAPGFQVLDSTAARSVSESGATTSYDVVLNQRPTSNVVIKVSVADNTELAAAATLTFTPDNWSISQSVMVTGMDDSLADGDQRTDVRFFVDKTVSDPGFSRAMDRFALVRTTDDESEIVSVQELAKVAYFLVGNSPRIERYSLATSAWLSPIALPDAYGKALVLHVNDEGLFVAYEKGIYRYGLEGTGETYLLTLSSVQGVHSDGNVLFISYITNGDTEFVTLDTRTNRVIQWYYGSRDLVFATTLAPATNTIVGRNLQNGAWNWVYFTYSDDGVFTSAGSRRSGYIPEAARTWLLPDQSRIANELGEIFLHPLSLPQQTFATPIDDLTFLSDGIPIALYGSKLTAFTQSLLPTRSYALAYEPDRIFVNDTHVITVSDDVSLPHGVRIDLVPLGVLNPPKPGEPLDPRGVPFTPDKIETAADGTLLLLSTAYQSIFRWDPQRRDYADTIQLSGASRFMAYSADTNTVYVGYEGRQGIFKVDLNGPTPVESLFVNSGAVSIATAGPYVFAMHSSGYTYAQTTFAPNGSMISTLENYSRSTSPVWSDTNQRMYFITTGGSPVDLLSREINEDGSNPLKAPGALGSLKDSPLHNSEGFTNPVLVAPDGSVVVLGSGVIHDATTLARLSITLPNSILDGAWLDGGLYTIRSIAGAAEVQKWSTGTYTLARAIQIPGSAIAIKPIGDHQVLAITMGLDGVPAFTLLDANLEPIDVAVPIAEPIVQIADDQNISPDHAKGAPPLQKVERNSGPLAPPPPTSLISQLASRLRAGDSVETPLFVAPRLALAVDQALSVLDDDHLSEVRADQLNGRLVRDLVSRLRLRLPLRI